MRAVGAAAVVAVVAGCASIPLSTPWALRNFTPETLLTADPRQIMAAVQVDERVELDVEGTELNLTVSSDGGADELEYSVALREQASGPRVIGLPPAETGSRWYVLVVNRDGARAVQELQGVMLKEQDKYSQMTINVRPRFVDQPPADLLQAFPLQLWVHLTPEIGFVKVFDDDLEFE